MIEIMLTAGAVIFSVVVAVMVLKKFNAPLSRGFRTVEYFFFGLALIAASFVFFVMGYRLYLLIMK